MSRTPPSTDRTPLSTARLVTIAGLLACAAGILLQGVSGIAMPLIPPGVVLLLIAVLVVAFAPWRWAPIVAVVVALAEAAGFFGTGSAALLVDPADLGVFASTWVRLVGIGTALVAGTVAAVAAYRRRP